MVDALRELARYDAMRQRSRELHEEHRQAVLTGSGRQHHDEAADAIVVEALHIAEQMAAAEGCLRAWTPSGDCDCGPCARLAKVRAALKALCK